MWRPTRLLSGRFYRENRDAKFGHPGYNSVMINPRATEVQNATDGGRDSRSFWEN